MKRGAVALLVVAMALASPRPVNPIYEWQAKALAFDQHWNACLRESFGCPLTGDTNAETCQRGRSFIDYKECAAARKEAKRLFDLTENAH